MPEFDWRSPDAYERMKNAEITGSAWEYLRRNPEYESDCSTIDVSAPVSSTFRSKWGLCFRR